MIGTGWWIGASASVMLVATLEASAAVLPPPVTAGAETGSTAPRLTVFGIPQPAAGAQPANLDGSLAQISQRYPTVSSDHPLRDLHQMNPAARFRLSTPLATPLVSIDAITTGDPQALKTALEALGLQQAAVFS